eukprot:Awhi_evm1s15319
MNTVEQCQRLCIEQNCLQWSFKYGHAKNTKKGKIYPKGVTMGSGCQLYSAVRRTSVSYNQYYLSGGQTTCLSKQNRQNPTPTPTSTFTHKPSPTKVPLPKFGAYPGVYPEPSFNYAADPLSTEECKSSCIQDNECKGVLVFPDGKF